MLKKKSEGCGKERSKGRKRRKTRIFSLAHGFIRFDETDTPAQIYSAFSALRKWKHVIKIFSCLNGHMRFISLF